MSNQMGFLDHLSVSIDARSCRISSNDPSGRNQDYWMIPPKSSIVLGELPGPGAIRHIWMTAFCKQIVGPSLLDPELNDSTPPTNPIGNACGVNYELYDRYYYRKLLLRITWENHAHPSVLVPYGDFFCIGDCIAQNVNSLPFTVVVKEEEEGNVGARASVSCYLPMPFNEAAKIELINEHDLAVGLYFHIDYELYRKPRPDILYFHAWWKREAPCNGWGPDIQVNSPEANVVNLHGEDNYVFLETKGRGHFVGCNLSVTHYQGTWWGEGDEMIFIDGEEEPSINGTGSEDYFNHAWGMQRHQSPYCGSIVHEKDFPGHQVSYRFHLLDPIRFRTSLKVTMEHGHGNHLSDDWASTVYWYQTLREEELGMQPVQERIPVMAELKRPYPLHPPALNAEMQAAKASVKSRFAKLMEAKERLLKRKVENAYQSAQRNTRLAQKMKERFDHENTHP